MQGKHRIAPITMVMAAIAASSALAADLPKEGTYDYTTCFAAANLAEIAFSEPYGAIIREWTGTNQSTVPGGFLDKTSFHCVAMVARLDGKLSATTYCDTLDKDGDKIFSRFVSDGTRAEATTLAGTGKYDGMMRTGTATNLGPFPVAKAGTFQTCVLNTGAYKLK